MATIKKLNNDEFQYTEQDLKCRFDFPFVFHLAKKLNVKNFDVNFTELYEVKYFLMNQIFQELSNVH